MTRNEILALKPGRELDALIAEKVMGWRKKTFPGGGGGFTAWVDENEKVMKLISNSTMSETCYRCDYFRPSTDISAAWEVEAAAMEIDRVEYVAALMQVVWNDMNYIELADPDNRTAWQAIPDLLRATPEQRCKAALLAVMGE